MKKKSTIIILGILIVAIAITVGVSFAIWQVTLQQSTSNIITTGCFKVTLEEGNAIALENAYPISDEEGMKLTPYTFTLKNSCTENASYVINLETISTGDKILADQYVKASLKNNENKLFLSTLDSTQENAEKVIESATKAYKLTTGVLKANESKTFELRLWLDENTGTINEVMNANYMGKITISSSYKSVTGLENVMLAMDLGFIENTCAPSEGCGNIYVNNLYTQNQKYVVKKVIYQSVMNPIENAEEIVDFSVSQDGTVLGYYVKDNLESESSTYTLYIQADGKVKVNPKASYYGLIYNHEYTPFEWNDIPKDTIIEGIENWDTSMVTDMSEMFSQSNFTELDLSHFDTSKVTNMYRMFSFMESLTSLNVSDFDTSNVTNMSEMFRKVNSLSNLDLSGFDTSNVTNMYNMFNKMESLTNLDLSNFDTSKVTDMSSMFEGMSNVTNLNLSNFDTSNVTNMQDMFQYNSNLTNIVYGNNFIKNSELNINYMYYQCPANKPTHSSWDGVSW